MSEALDTMTAFDATGRGMVEGFARVVAADDGTAWLEPEAAAACGGCVQAKRCASARLAPRQTQRFPVANDFEADVGERVVIGIGEGALLRASACAYLIPLGAMVLSAMSVSGLGGGDGAAALAAFAGLGAGLVVARMRARSLFASGKMAPVYLRRAFDDLASCNREPR